MINQKAKANVFNKYLPETNCLAVENEESIVLLENPGYRCNRDLVPQHPILRTHFTKIEFNVTDLAVVSCGAVWACRPKSSFVLPPSP